MYKIGDRVRVYFRPANANNGSWYSGVVRGVVVGGYEVYINEFRAVYIISARLITS